MFQNAFLQNRNLMQKFFKIFLNLVVKVKSRGRKTSSLFKLILAFAHLRGTHELYVVIYFLSEHQKWVHQYWVQCHLPLPTTGVHVFRRIGNGFVLLPKTTTAIQWTTHYNQQHHQHRRLARKNDFHFRKRMERDERSGKLYLYVLALIYIDWNILQ